MPDDSAIDAGRRRVLAATLAAALPVDRVARAHGVADLPAASVTGGADSQSETVFPQGVASGDPTTTGAVLWTRVAPDLLDDGTPLQVTVARDDAFEDVVGSWSVPADRLDDHDATVKVDLDGRLDPDAEYAYRFDYDGATSPVGRCRTLPAADASPDSVRLGLATCQNYRRGYYGAFHHLAAESVDFLVHLGDFIYEHGGDGDVPGRSLPLPSGESIAMGLEDYRYLHRTYRSDAFLQEALSAHTLIQTWDDHEIVNNRYWNYSEARPYAGEGDHPKNDDGEFMTRLFADGIRAWWEYTPTRVPYDPEAESLLDQLELWRSFRFGDLVELLVTDERLYRTSPTDGSQLGARPDDDASEAGDGRNSDAGESEDDDGDESDDDGEDGDDLAETMLGSTQRAWFTDRLAGSSAAWTAWVNEVLAMEFDLDLGAVDVLNGDAWDAFPEERERILDSAEEGDAAFVALTGDMHSTLTGYVERDGDRAGVEFMTPAVTSRNLRDLLSLPNDRETRRLIADYVTDENPNVEFFDSHRWGYAVVEFTPEACTFSAYAVDRATDSRDASRRLLTRYRCPIDSYELSEV